MFIAGAYIIICGVRFVFEKHVFVIWPIIEPLAIDIAACCGVPVSNFHTEAGIIKVEVDGFEKCSLHTIAISTFRQPFTPILEIESNSQVIILGLCCAR